MMQSPNTHTAVAAAFAAAEKHGYTLRSIDAGRVEFVRPVTNSDELLREHGIEIGDYFVAEFDAAGDLAGSRVIGANFSFRADLRDAPVTGDPFARLDHLLRLQDAPIAVVA